MAVRQVFFHIIRVVSHVHVEETAAILDVTHHGTVVINNLPAHPITQHTLQEKLFQAVAGLAVLLGRRVKFLEFHGRLLTQLITDVH